VILRDLAPFLRPLLVVSIALLGLSCKRGAQDGADASTEGGALSAEGGAGSSRDAAPSVKAAGSGELQQAEPAAPPSDASFGDMVCIGRGTGGKGAAPVHRPAPQPPPRAGRGASAAPTAHPRHALEIDHPLEVKILHRSMCFTGSCTSAPATCTATRRGFTITLNARVPSPSTPPVKPCTAECAPAVAKCQTDALPAGTYTVELEGRKHFVQIPSLSPPPCAN